MKHSKQIELLSPEDIKFLPELSKFLKTLKGEARALSNRQIQAKFPDYFTGVSRGKLTALIHEVRIRKLVRNLVGSPLGFYCSNDPVVVKRYAETLQQHIKARRDSLKSFGDNPGAGLSMKVKVKGHFKGKSWIKGYTRTANGYKGSSQMTFNFEVPVGKTATSKKQYNQIKLF